MRLKDWDYSADGAYFITICTKDRKHDFGKIKKERMFLSPIGKIAENFWKEIENIHKHVILDEFVVMPNHIHGIIFIQNESVETRHWRVSTQTQFGKLPPKSISSIINHFKGGTKKWANKNEYENFMWQKNFYDHIVRNEEELNRIRQYIIDNPMNWENDRNNFENLYI